MSSVAASAALIAANSANNGQTLNPKVIIAFYLVISFICIIIWIYAAIEFFVKKVKYTTLKNYVFNEGFGFGALILFIMLYGVLAFILLMYLTIKLL
jgi:hypothetical protein